MSQYVVAKSAPQVFNNTIIQLTQLFFIHVTVIDNVFIPYVDMTVQFRFDHLNETTLDFCFDAMFWVVK